MKTYNCETCVRADCIHRDAYDRLPVECGGLGLCPGHIAATDGTKLDELIAEMEELDAAAREAKDAADAIRDEIKSYMALISADEVTTDKYVVRWTETVSNRLDTTALKRNAPDVYTAYLKQTTSRRFSVSH